MHKKILSLLSLLFCISFVSGCGGNNESSKEQAAYSFEMENNALCGFEVGDQGNLLSCNTLDEYSYSALVVSDSLIGHPMSEVLSVYKEGLFINGECRTNILMAFSATASQSNIQEALNYTCDVFTINNKKPSIIYLTNDNDPNINSISISYTISYGKAKLIDLISKCGLEYSLDQLAYQTMDVLFGVVSGLGKVALTNFDYLENDDGSFNFDINTLIEESKIFDAAKTFFAEEANVEVDYSVYPDQVKTDQVVLIVTATDNATKTVTFKLIDGVIEDGSAHEIEFENVSNIYEEFDLYLSGIVEPFVNDISNRVLGQKYKDYRQYIYDFILYNGKAKLAAKLINMGKTIYEYLLDQFPNLENNISSFKISYGNYDLERFYTVEIYTKTNDYYHIVGNAFTCFAMKAYKNGVAQQLNYVLTDSGFSLSAISDKTHSGQF